MNWYHHLPSCVYGIGELAKLHTKPAALLGNAPDAVFCHDERETRAEGRIGDDFGRVALSTRAPPIARTRQLELPPLADFQWSSIHPSKPGGLVTLARDGMGVLGVLGVFFIRRAGSGRVTVRKAGADS